ncbi:MAG: B12-binding domain-containing radical SAM protein [Candidatus Omnitrophica bacterium CG_4_10_14_0_2_um_filter_44_9]|nr:MAG: B12-binding domain-containing radical SAM protein [Candidatus Omnitrophica bacterium CG_4_10_14_0_2_um_filter_44_9]
MKKVLLISANQEKVPYPVAPIGLLYVANALKKAKFDVSILDLCFSGNTNDDIKKTIKQREPDFIGVSLRNVDNLTFPRSVSYLPAIKKIIKTTRRYTDAPLVLGGSAFSLFPKQILSYLGCEWGIVGEGEEAFVNLLKQLNAETNNLNTINNLVWRQDSRINSNPASCLRSPFDFVLDYGLINNYLYANFAGMMNVQTKRGCRFKCSYCTYPSIEGKSYRLRSPAIIAQEVSLLQKKYAIPHVFFVDDVFTYPANHALLVCEALLSKNIKMPWSCFASPYGITKKLLMFMKKAGCTHIEFGSDALSNRVLKKLRKPFAVQDVLKASSLCKEIGIKCAHYIIFGAPGENDDTLREGFATIRKLHGDAIIAMVGIRIYPGTELENLSIHDGVISKQTDLLFPHFYLSRELPTNKLLEKVAKFARENSSCIVPGLEIRSSEKMYAVLRKHYHQGPLWGYLG